MAASLVIADAKALNKDMKPARHSWEALKLYLGLAAALREMDIRENNATASVSIVYRRTSCSRGPSGADARSCSSEMQKALDDSKRHFGGLYQALVTRTTAELSEPIKAFQKVTTREHSEIGRQLHILDVTSQQMKAGVDLGRLLKDRMQQRKDSSQAVLLAMLDVQKLRACLDSVNASDLRRVLQYAGQKPSFITSKAKMIETALAYVGQCKIALPKISLVAIERAVKSIPKDMLGFLGTLAESQYSRLFPQSGGDNQDEKRFWTRLGAYFVAIGQALVLSFLVQLSWIILPFTVMASVFNEDAKGVATWWSTSIGKHAGLFYAAFRVAGTREWEEVRGDQSRVQEFFAKRPFATLGICLTQTLVPLVGLHSLRDIVDIDLYGTIRKHVEEVQTQDVA